MELLDRIEKHLKDNHISATRFGRRAVGDPRFVLDLRNGRIPRRKTIERLEAYIESIKFGVSRKDPRNEDCARQVARNDALPPAKVLRRPARTNEPASRSSHQ